mmetsp:Transcript_3935/g.12198  ORF Transcript_3935/g.12198 Transcript_3935/m.12198 type:complete len:87 (+) Transcript_3935:91-351(+)
MSTAQQQKGATPSEESLARRRRPDAEQSAEEVSKRLFVAGFFALPVFWGVNVLKFRNHWARRSLVALGLAASVLLLGLVRRHAAPE